LNKNLLCAGSVFRYKSTVLEGIGWVELSELDTIFGEPRPPNQPAPRASEWNADQLRTYVPMSLVTLDEENGKNVAKLFLAAKHGPNDQVLKGLAVIWLIDEAGNIRLALEEISEADSFWYEAENKGTPAPTWFPEAEELPPVRKLGHPTLIDHGSARIGGEIEPNFASDRAEVDFDAFVNNKSRRYGNERSLKQYAEVARLFHQVTGMKVGVRMGY
jgi:hypothetical protein